MVWMPWLPIAGKFELVKPKPIWLLIHTHTDTSRLPSTDLPLLNGIVPPLDLDKSYRFVRLNAAGRQVFLLSCIVFELPICQKPHSSTTTHSGATKPKNASPEYQKTIFFAFNFCEYFTHHKDFMIVWIFIQWCTIRWQLHIELSEYDVQLASRPFRRIPFVSLSFINKFIRCLRSSLRFGRFCASFDVFVASIQQS